MDNSWQSSSSIKPNVLYNVSVDVGGNVMHLGTGYVSSTISVVSNTPKVSTEDFKPTKIIFSNLVTICFWKDGTKTIVKCVDEDLYDQENAVAWCIAYKVMGSKNQFRKLVKSGYVQVDNS